MLNRRVGINRLNHVLDGANTPDVVGSCGVAECPPGGGGPLSAIARAIACRATGHCPARFALDSGQQKARTRFRQASSRSKG